MSIEDEAVIITGSNSGIGLGIAREMARTKAHVVLNWFSDSAEDHRLAANLS